MSKLNIYGFAQKSTLFFSQQRRKGIYQQENFKASKSTGL